MKQIITPIVQYTDAATAIDWLVRVLGFTTQGVSIEAGGGISGTALRFGNSALVVRAMAAAPVEWNAVRLGIHVCASAAEATAIRDPGGFLWSRSPNTIDVGDGEVTIVPELRYPEVGVATAWLTTTFGLQTTFQVAGPDGTPAHIEMRLGEGTVFIAPLPPERTGPFADVSQFLDLVVDDPDRHHAHAKAAGANIVIKPTDTPFGARFYALRDTENMLWWVSTYRPAASERLR